MYSESLKTKTEAIAIAQKFSKDEDNGYYTAIIWNSLIEDYHVKGNDPQDLRQNEVIIGHYMHGKYIR